jgi:hypothetical protein
MYGIRPPLQGFSILLSFRPRAMPWADMDQAVGLTTTYDIAFFAPAEMITTLFYL